MGNHRLQTAQSLLQEQAVHAEEHSEVRTGVCFFSHPSWFSSAETGYFCCCFTAFPGVRGSQCLKCFRLSHIRSFARLTAKLVGIKAAGGLEQQLLHHVLQLRVTEVSGSLQEPGSGLS